MDAKSFLSGQFDGSSTTAEAEDSLERKVILIPKLLWSHYQQVSLWIGFWFSTGYQQKFSHTQKNKLKTSNKQAEVPGPAEEAIRGGTKESQVSELKGPWRASPGLTSPLSKVRGLQLLLVRGSETLGTPGQGPNPHTTDPKVGKDFLKCRLFRARCCITGQNKKWREEMPKVTHQGLTRSGYSPCRIVGKDQSQTGEGMRPASALFLNYLSLQWVHDLSIPLSPPYQICSGKVK